MSVLSYLSARASDAVLSGLEKHSITRSTNLLKTRLHKYLGAQIKEQIRFGSSTRGTILPRSMDEKSDIDYMIVFSDNDFTPQTYLDRLRKFVGEHYPQHTIYQSSPTIVLELNHIKFDLVPAVNSFWSGLQIPDGKEGWQSTNPEKFSEKLSVRNAECDRCLKPAIRLVKHWNAENGYPFESFPLEQWIAAQFYPFCNNLKDYVFKIFEDLHSSYDVTPSQRSTLKQSADIVKSIKRAEKSDPRWAATEIVRLIPNKKS